MVQNLKEMDLQKEVSQLVEKFIDDESIFLVDVNIKGKPGNQKIQVFIDGDDHVGVDICTNISRKLSEALDEMDLVEGKYVIEVSSPGVDNPLLFIRQYSKHIGRELEIKTKDKKIVQGVLLSVENDTIELTVKSSKVKRELDSTTLKLAFSEIETAKVVLRF